MFLDTADFRLYNNSFILRRRTAYQDGFPIADPEIVFKYRSNDLEKAAGRQRPPRKIAGPYRIKFKSEALPLKDQTGSFRLLYAHNCIFPISSVHAPDRTNLKAIATGLPALAGLIGELEGSVELVNATLVEEVLMDIGKIDFGKGTVAKASIPLWRSLGDHSVIARVCVPDEVRQHRQRSRPRQTTRRGAFIRLQADRTGLAAARHHQDGARVSPEGQPAAKP